MTSKQWPLNIRELGDSLAALSLAEGALLAEYLEEVHGIRNAQRGNLLEPMRGAITTLASMGSATHVCVVYEGLADPARKISVIKVLREITGCGLAEAKDLSEHPSRTIRSRVPINEGQDVKRRLEDAGARVSLRPESGA
jgi:large subunit ribosomal protein L7/L12